MYGGSSVISSFVFPLSFSGIPSHNLFCDERYAECGVEELAEGVILDLMEIPGGTFFMGTDKAEIKRLCKKFDVTYFKWEKPQHQVTLQPFAMGRYPITQAQWKAIAERQDLRINMDLDPDPSRFKDDPLQPPLDEGEKPKTRWDRPAEGVNWYQAQEFCDRLSKLTGQPYRLPTEAEWEYACRANTTTAFHFGETITGDLANYRASSTYADEPKGEYRSQTTPVGYFKVANGFAICTETSGSGVKTIFTATMKVRPLMAVLGLMPKIPMLIISQILKKMTIISYIKSYAAVLGPTVLLIAVAPSASTPTRAPTTLMSVFE